LRILVTGGAGFIGSHLCEKLIGEHEIVCYDNFCEFYSPEMKERNITELVKKDKFTLIRADIRDKFSLYKAFSDNDFDLVIHLAAMAGVRPSIENPELYYDVNVTGTLNILECCRKHQVSKLIFASSSSVYGNNRKVPFSETDNVDFPISPYAATKKSCELMIYNYYHLYGISALCLRFFTVYGPRQRPDLAIRKFAELLFNGDALPLYGDGSSKRDYTYIDDITDGVAKAITYVSENKVYEVFNLGESRTVSLLEMVDTLERTTGIPAEINWLSLQPGDVNCTFADISKSRSLLGYNPGFNFEEGIFRFINWLRLL